MSELPVIQKWLTSILVKPGKIPDKISAADAHYGLSHQEVIRSSEGKPSLDRIMIYARGYVLRLMECLRAEYPVLQNLMGEELFDSFAMKYLVHLPSKSFTLFDLGKYFPDYLKASHPKLNKDDPKREQFEFPVEIARFERAKSEVYRNKGIEGLQNHTENEPFDFLFLGINSIAVSPCLFLLELQFPVLDFVTHVECGEHPPIPLARKNYTTISRINYRVHATEIEPWQWHYLQALEKTGNSDEAVKQCSIACEKPEETIRAELLIWIPIAVHLGLVYYK